MNDPQTEVLPKKGFIKKYIPIPALIFLVLGVVSAAIYAGFIISVDFADFFNENVSPVFRFLLAKITSVLPFSVGEAVILCSPILLFLSLRATFRYMDAHEYGFTRALITLVSVLFLLFSVFVFDFAAGYRASTLYRKLDLNVGSINEESVEKTARYVVGKINELSDEVTFTAEGSIRGFTHAETVEKCHESYEKLAEEYDFITNFKAPVKRLAASSLVTYTHVSGMYSFFTGEANLNTNYPDYITVYTIAHEMAHQRGIARENEANFIAYLVCIGSDDAYLRYSGYMNMFEYLTDVLPTETFRDVVSEFDGSALSDIVAYYDFFSKYEDSVASEVVDTVNNTYLQSQGTEGTVSYGMVVDLAVAYHEADSFTE